MRLSKLKLTRNPHNINESLIKSKRKRNRHTLTKKKKKRETNTINRRKTPLPSFPAKRQN